jgi:hypothetical protein
MNLGEPSPYKKLTLYLILITAVCRSIAASMLELGNDEAYYWLYSLHLQWNYFDHPPLVAFWIRASTLNNIFSNEGFIRLGSVVSCALSTWFMFKTASTAFSQRAGWYTACLFNASFYVSVTTGVYILPDSPQIVFWTFSLYMLARIVKDESAWLNWLMFGTGCGLCMMSKVHGIFILTGLVLFIIFKKRKWLKNPGLYFSLFVAIVIFLPVIIWNFRHDFITYKFHSQRVSLISTNWNMKTFFTEIFSQLFLNNPVNVILIFVSFFSVSFKNSAGSIYKFIGIPLALLLIFISLTRETLGHWSGPAYVSLLPLAGKLVEEKYKGNFPFVLKLSQGVFILGITGGLLLLNYYPGTWGDQNKKDLGRHDYSLDMYGWEKAGKQFSEFYHEQLHEKSLPENTPLVCTFWSGCHVEYYFAKPAGISMIGLGTAQNLHHYFWLNRYRNFTQIPDTALCVLTSDIKWPGINSFRKYYSKIRMIKEIEISRSGKPAHYFYIYFLTAKN